jgi:hypothetical protein
VAVEIYKASGDDESAPGDRIELIVADTPQDLVDAINERLALGFRVVTRIDVMNDSRWMASLQFNRCDFSRLTGVLDREMLVATKREG